MNYHKQQQPPFETFRRPTHSTMGFLGAFASLVLTEKRGENPPKNSNREHRILLSSHVSGEAALVQPNCLSPPLGGNSGLTSLAGIAFSATARSNARVDRINTNNV